MRFIAALMLAAAFGCALANDREIQRALIQRDQQSAEFAARVRGADTSALQQLHSRQLLDVTTQKLSPDPEVARQLQTYQRQKMADERALVLPPPAVTLARKAEKPLPLPGGPGHVVDPIPAQGLFP
jgi:hypothetical protein